MENVLLERIAVALEQIAKELNQQNELLLAITYSKAGEEIRNEAGELNTRYIRGTK